MLVHYDIVTKAFTEIIKPFRASGYFFGDNGGRIYFATTTGLKCRIEGDIFDVTVLDPESFLLRVGDSQWIESPFYSFDRNAQEDFTRNAGVSLKFDHLYYFDGEERIRLLKTYRARSNRHKFKAHPVIRSIGIILPGGRYYLPGSVRSEEYSGALLFDLKNTLYKELPEKTAVYLNVNTTHEVSYHLSESGLAHYLDPTEPK